MKESLVIKPRQATAMSVELNGVDFLFGMMRAEWAYLFKDSIDVKRMCTALETVVEHFPLACGRIVIRDLRFYIEKTDAGVLVEILESDAASPEFGPDVFPLPAEGLMVEFPRVIRVSALEETPIAAFRFTRYRDGRVTLGISFCHGVTDAAGIAAFLNAWCRAYAGEPVIPPTLDRGILRSLGTNLGSPSALSGFTPVAAGSSVLREAPKMASFGGFTLGAIEYSKLVKLVEQKYPSVSFNDFLQAMLLKVFAQSSPDDDSKTTSANMAYDLRRLKISKVPVNYFGNATLYRSLGARFEELRNIDVLTLAERFREFCRPNPEVVKQDVGYCQGEYEAGNINQFGSFSKFFTPLVNGGVYINNMLAVTRSLFSCEDNVIWGDIPIRLPFVTKMIILTPNRAGGISIRFALPAEQIPAFQTKWRVCLGQVLADA